MVEVVRAAPPMPAVCFFRRNLCSAAILVPPFIAPPFVRSAVVIGDTKFVRSTKILQWLLSVIEP